MSPRGGKKLLTESMVLRLDKPLRGALQALADADRRPLAVYIRFVLEDHVQAKKKRGR